MKRAKVRLPLLLTLPTDLWNEIVTLLLGESVVHYFPLRRVCRAFRERCADAGPGINWYASLCAHSPDFPYGRPDEFTLGSGRVFRGALCAWLERARIEERLKSLRAYPLNGERAYKKVLALEREHTRHTLNYAAAKRAWERGELYKRGAAI